MNTQIEKYLESLDLFPILDERVRERAAAFEFLGGELKRVFLSQTQDPAVIGEVLSHQRESAWDYSGMWGFTQDCWMESRGFSRDSDTDISPYVGSIMYLGIESDNLVIPGPANQDSRMCVEVETRNVRYSSLTAIGKNCDALLSIVHDLLLPNLVGAPAGSPDLGAA